MTEPGSAVVVVGSLNQDVVAEVAHLPHAGETVTATGMRSNVGGKGANQAVAARRLGADVAFVARVGDDETADWLRAGLTRAGLGTDRVRTVPGQRSGTAYITVGRGENTIVLDPGANHAWTGGLGVDEDVVRSARVLVLQQEVPADLLDAAVRATRGRVILNAAPSRPVDAHVLKACDPLVLNEHELRDQVGSGPGEPLDVLAAMRSLLERGATSVVTTLGSAGAHWCTLDHDGEAPAPRVTARDTTGAGDAFVGALAHRLQAGNDLADAVRWAVAAASLSVGAPGTHDSYPRREQVHEALESAGRRTGDGAA